MIVHAGLIARFVAGSWRGVLVEGPSGSGKSDLALRALSVGFRLISDDQTRIWVSGGRLYGRAPGPIAGQMEVRGLGILPFSHVDTAQIVLCPRPGEGERIPEDQVETYLGLCLPLVILPYLTSSAPSKLVLALQHLGA